MNPCNIQSLIFYRNVTPYLHLAIHTEVDPANKGRPIQVLKCSQPNVLAHFFLFLFFLFSCSANHHSKINDPQCNSLKRMHALCSSPYKSCKKKCIHHICINCGLPSYKTPTIILSELESHVANTQWFAARSINQ